MAFTQSRMESPEELATLFSRQMTFQQPAPQQTQQVPPQQQSEPEPIIYSISQHYHHSAHVVVQQQDHPMHQRPSSVPPKPTQPSVEQVLIVHGVNPTALSPQQLELFKTADAPQQQRLLELWTIYPPTNNTQTDASVTWSSTTVEQEEFLAQLRHEQMVAERDAQMSLDGTPLTPVQSTDGHWVSAAYVEPYMMSGYEMLARREYEESGKEEGKDVYFGSYRLATDPVYAGGWNGRNKMVEHQYGEFQQMSAMEF